ncbi:RluA family pseudouridine synthase [Magnetospirillum sp. UT-4]|uniref:RluA family pseudouridine synthase n=1 Tax=Magnetospirillum sp. UT-4 TaxID=2681467 RepID=UPI00137DA08B|nr:RluA family pseudouridine synthase [Magnetospirillum sp. UT-4]CAA7622515.1 Ribosomal large subunit pseudouridine synthase D [Magnetospirillum sp. UT-4]
MSAVTILTPAAVLPEEAGTRLDKWLSARLPELSRTRVKGLIEDGAVTSAGATITDASAKVKAGQDFTVAVPPDAPAEPEPQAMDLVVVYEDDELIVIDKPAGLVVHPAPGSPDRTLVNALLAHCGESLSGIGGVRRPGIVHRLDKDTSGLMVAAKTDRAHHALSAQFAAHSIERAYVALVWGRPAPPEGEVVGNIGRSTQDRKKMALVKGGGKFAHTRYRTIRSFAHGLVSLVECRLATGRTHQIRVHMTSLGHPLVGDQTYGRSRPPRAATLCSDTGRHLAGFPRQALHAYLLGFDHPTSGERLRFESTIPFDIKALIGFLEGI